MSASLKVGYIQLAVALITVVYCCIQLEVVRSGKRIFKKLNKKGKKCYKMFKKYKKIKKRLIKLTRELNNNIMITQKNAV